jgi:hypothetical protein
MSETDFTQGDDPFADTENEDFSTLPGDDVGDDDPFASTEPGQQPGGDGSASTATVPLKTVEREGNEISSESEPLPEREPEPAETAAATALAEPQATTEEPQTVEGAIAAIQAKPPTEAVPQSLKDAEVETLRRRNGEKPTSPQAQKGTAEKTAKAAKPIAKAKPAKIDTPTKEPVAAAPKTGSTTRRRYKILQPEADGVYSTVSWQDPSGSEQTVALAIDGDAALIQVFRALGEPDGGLTLVPVAETHFRERTIATDEPPPVKRKLKIG